MYLAGEKRIGTNEVKFNQIFACESLPQLRLIFEEYYKITGHDMEKAIKAEMSGDVKQAFLAISKSTTFQITATIILSSFKAQVAKNKASYYAMRLYKSMKVIIFYY